MPSSVASRTLAVTGEAIPVFLGKPTLVPVRLSGREGVNSLFSYELLLKTADGLDLGASAAADFDLDAFIGREISCSIELDGAGSFVPGMAGASTDHLGAGTREINAFISEAELWGEEGRHLQYRLTLRPCPLQMKTIRYSSPAPCSIRATSPQDRAVHLSAPIR